MEITFGWLRAIGLLIFHVDYLLWLIICFLFLLLKEWKDLYQIFKCETQQQNEGDSLEQSLSFNLSRITRKSWRKNNMTSLGCSKTRHVFIFCLGWSKTCHILSLVSPSYISVIKLGFSNIPFYLNYLKSWKGSIWFRFFLVSQVADYLVLSCWIFLNRIGLWFIKWNVPSISFLLKYIDSLF